MLPPCGLQQIHRVAVKSQMRTRLCSKGDKWLSYVFRTKRWHALAEAEC